VATIGLHIKIGQLFGNAGHHDFIVIIIIIIHEYLEAGLTASISTQHIYHRHELQHELY